MSEQTGRGRLAREAAAKIVAAGKAGLRTGNWISGISGNEVYRVAEAYLAALAATRAPLEAKVAELAEELRIAEADVTHFVRLAFVDPGANPAISWQERAEKAESEVARLNQHVSCDQKTKLDQQLREKSP